MDFNPFDKPIQEVEFDDLETLEEENVAEGIYVEYKREFPDPQAVAKGIASFANTHGGYFFIGIADEDVTNIAQGQIGVNTNERTQPKEDIRNIARDHLDPTPDFTIRVIQRPDYTDYAILIVEVPESRNAPHIQSDGKIYVRTGEASNPVEPETDRWSIDRLYQRRDEWQEAVQDFCTIDFEDHRDRPIVELFSVPSTLGNPVCCEVVEDLEGFEDHMRDRSFDVTVTTESGDTVVMQGRDHNMRFESFRSTSEGVVAQAWVSGARATMHPTMFLFLSDGGLKIHHPIPYGNFNAGTEDGVEELMEGHTRDLKVVNGTWLLPQIYRMMDTYLNLLEEADWFTDTNREIELKARFRKLDGSVLGFDYAEYIEYMESHGPPLTYEDVVEVPRYRTQTITSTELQDESDASVFEFSGRLMEGLGLPHPRFLDLIRSETRPIGVFHEEGVSVE